MYELKQLGDRTYYIASPSNVGIYIANDNEAYLIDSGNDRSVAKKILNILTENGWHLKAIINTHSHADHIGGNNYLQAQTNCDIYTPDLESSFVHTPLFESVVLYGGYPHRKLRNKFLMAKPSKTEPISTAILPKGLDYISLNGHANEMIGVRTSDDVCFIGDMLINEETIAKYHLSYTFNFEAYLDSLTSLEELSATWFVSSHVTALKDVKPLIDINRKNTLELIGLVKQACNCPSTLDEIVKHVFDSYHMELNHIQYALACSTIRSCLSYLFDRKEVTITYDNNLAQWALIK